MKRLFVSLALGMTAATILAAPKITHHGLAGQGLLVQGTNGSPAGAYSLVATTNLLQPLEQWQPVASGHFDLSGNFKMTNTLAVGGPWFFRIRAEATNAPDFSQIGFASAAYDVTGGAGGQEVTVTTGDELQTYADANEPYVIYVSGTLQISGMDTHVRSHKTIIGLGANATLQGGGLYFYKSTNVIVRNLTIRDSDDDNTGVTTYSQNIWFDHCDFVDSTDGNLDITKGSDFVTISWCRFYYTQTNNYHRFVNLIGASDGDAGRDTGRLHVTLHHNWWGTNCVERMASVRFGRVHLYNNYYNSPGNNYCVRTRIDAETRIENNYFENVQNPWEVYITGAGDPLGKVFATNNLEVNTTWTGTTTNGDATIRLIVPGTNDVFMPSYSYIPDPAAQVKTIVTQNAGPGHGPFVP